MLYLVRHVEVGRDAQQGRRKLQRDLLEVLGRALPGARFTTDVGRLFIEAAEDATEVLARVHGILSFSVCERCDLDDLEQRVVAFAAERLRPGQTFAVRVKRSHAPGLSSQELAADLGSAIVDAVPHTRVDLDSPQVMIGIEVRRGECWLFDATVPGRDHGAASVAAGSEPRFVADQMLGRLARWLRLFGFDTEELPHVADSVLLRKARDESRILLTRDRPLAGARSVQVVLLRSQETEAQLQELADGLKLSFDRRQFFSRCTLCNAPLQVRAKHDVIDQVPPRVALAHQEFRYCERCDKLYWPGDHHARILETYERLMSRSQ